MLFQCEIISARRLERLVKASEESEVWIARNLDTGECEILKVFRRGSIEGARTLALARLLGDSKPEGILAFKDFGLSEAKFTFFAAECAACGSLAEILARRGKLSLGGCIRLLKNSLCALSKLHSLGVVHRDIKPANILIEQSGKALLSDFGIAKIPGFKDAKGRVFGSAPYMSPEQALDSSKVDFRSDFFSLASVACECLTGRRRYDEKSFAETLKAILSDKRPVESELEPLAGKELAGLLAQMSARSPKDRPESAGAILEKLNSMPLPDEAICGGPLTARSPN